MIKVILTVIFVLICIFLSAVILLQEGKSAGLGSISGMADSYWGRNKSRSMEGKLEKLTKWAAFAWMVLAFVLNLKVWG
ncbi:MAG: preprotein translocase subunit SecG [Clostridium sp.]|nr:preprotein translocase subunit SecG [Clostridium sp.]